MSFWLSLNFSNQTWVPWQMMCTIVHSQSIAAITRGAVATSLFALNMTNVTTIMDPLLSVKSKGKGCAERETEHIINILAIID